MNETCRTCSRDRASRVAISFVPSQRGLPWRSYLGARGPGKQDHGCRRGWSHKSFCLHRDPLAPSLGESFDGQDGGVPWRWVQDLGSALRHTKSGTPKGELDLDEWPEMPTAGSAVSVPKSPPTLAPSPAPQVAETAGAGKKNGLETFQKTCVFGSSGPPTGPRWLRDRSEEKNSSS